jgi:hypothetical protein
VLARAGVPVRLGIAAALAFQMARWPPACRWPSCAASSPGLSARASSARRGPRPLNRAGLKGEMGLFILFSLVNFFEGFVELFSLVNFFEGFVELFSLVNFFEGFVELFSLVNFFEMAQGFVVVSQID